MAEIEETLSERGSTYGDFREQGRITQNLKRAAHDSPNWPKLPSYMREGIEMVLHKIARILNGNPLYDDNLHDMVGYTKLMQDRAAQDRDAGVVIEGGGDPMYPTYQHEDKGSSKTPKQITPRMPQGGTTLLGGGRVDGKYSIPMINDFSFGGSISRVEGIMKHCYRGGIGEARLDIRDIENLVHLAKMVPCGE